MTASDGRFKAGPATGTQPAAEGPAMLAAERPPESSGAGRSEVADARETISGGELVPLGEREAILEKLRQVRFEDYFMILGLHRDGPLSDDDVRNAHRRWQTLLDPARFSGHVSDDFMDHLLEIRSGLDDAAEVLGEPLLRERYRRAIRQAEGL